MLAFKPRRRRWMIGGLTLAIAALFAVLFVASSGAVLSGSPSQFESNDGNMTVGGNTPSTLNGLHDWSNVSYDTKVDLASSQSDDSFVSGQKQDTTCPDTTTHGNPPKDDFTNVAAFSDVATDGTPFLYGATIRYSVNGTASENVELKQGTDGLCPGSTTLLKRVANDKLLAIDYLNGGANVQFSVLTWITSGACYVGSDTAPCWGANPLALSSAGAEGRVNPLDISTANNPIGGADIKAGQFAEFGVNLQTAGIVPAGTCVSFPQTVWESRSSGSSFVSTTKDITIENHTIQNCGSITIIKHTAPTRGIDQAFTYSTTGAHGLDASFSLNDTGNSTGESACDPTASPPVTVCNTRTFGNLSPRTYTVSEDTPATGWVFTSLNCHGGAFGATDVTQNSSTATIVLAAGDSVVCTYVNTQQLGAIKILKTSSKSAHGVLAGATFSITQGGSAILGSPFTSDANGLVCVDGLAFAGYVVTETGAPTGYSRDDTTGHTVTVGTNSSCPSTGIPTTQSLTFRDTPLTNVVVTATSQVTGGTASSITCTGPGTSTANIGNSPQPATGFADPVTVTANGLSPGTYTCTVVVDP